MDVETLPRTNSTSRERGCRCRLQLQLSPATADIAEAREWMEAFRAAGVEGLVVKGASSRYVAGRGWVKYKTRETVEVIAGGVIGPLKQPEVLIAGRYRGSELVQVGRDGSVVA